MEKSLTSGRLRQCRSPRDAPAGLARLFQVLVLMTK
jgi:hypothetical protein